MSWIAPVVSAVVDRSRLVIAVVLVVTLVVGAGVPAVEESSQVALADDSETAAANEFVAANFTEGDPNTTTAVVAVEHPDNALSQDALVRELAFQEALATNESVNETLVESAGLANLVAMTAMETDRDPDEDNATAAAQPPIDEQRSQLESMTDAEVAAIVAELTDPDSDHPQQRTAEELLPRTIEPGASTAESRLLAVTMETDEPVVLDAGVSESVTESQLATRDLAHDQPGPETYRVVGSGLVGDREEAAIEDSLAIVGPLAALFVLVALSIAYRDPLDIALGIAGVGVVLIWTIGLMGWLAIDLYNSR